jgi:hypothetical protein
MDMAAWPDDAILVRFNDLTALADRADDARHRHGDQGWLDRHAWFHAACTRLIMGQPVVAYDG